METAEQRTFLQAESCHEMQGFHFSKPLTALKFSELMRGPRLRAG